MLDKVTPYPVTGLAMPYADRLVAAVGLAGVFQWSIP